jgi:hypothetical protein
LSSLSKLTSVYPEQPLTVSPPLSFRSSASSASQHACSSAVHNLLYSCISNSTAAYQISLLIPSVSDPNSL